MSGLVLTSPVRWIPGSHIRAAPSRRLVARSENSVGGSLWGHTTAVRLEDSPKRGERVVREGDYPIKRSLSALTRRLRTTPGQMRFATATTALMTGVVGIAAITVLHTRHDATQAIASVAQPSLVHASNAYASFSDADATASVAFLTGDLDLVYGRDRYMSDLSSATAELAAISRTAGATAAVESSIFAINAQLPTYTGLVETARSNNRQGFPVGAAYLRRASETMRIAILPEVLSIYREETSKLGAAYDSGASRTGPLFLLVIGAALIVLMVGVQFWLARRTHRTLNLGWLAATVITAGAAVLVGAVIASNSHNLDAARRRASNPTAQLSSARILALRAQADESLALIARGSGTTFSEDFNEVAMRLGSDSHSGLIEQVQGTLRGLGGDESANKLAAGWSDFLQEHRLVIDHENKGQYPDAINRTSKNEAPHLVEVVGVLDQEIEASQQRFSASSKGASFDAPGMYIVVVLGAVLVCGLIGAGIYPRLREYR
jgi:hypothetical protein